MLRSKVLSLLARGASTRMMSTGNKLTTVEVNDKTGIATLTMCRPPVNGLNLELLQDLKTSIDEIEGNKSRGLILTSVNYIRILKYGVYANNLYILVQRNNILCWLRYPGDVQARQG